MNPPKYNDDYREVRETVIDIGENRGGIRLTLFASKEDRQWAVAGEVIAPVADHRDKESYSPKHDFYTVRNKTDIPDCVKALAREMEREAERYQKSVDSDASSFFSRAVSEVK